LRLTGEAGICPYGCVRVRRKGFVRGWTGQPQQPPPQQPPEGTEAWGAAATPVMPAIDSSRWVSGWPSGQGAPSVDSLIGRDTSKVRSQVRHRYS